MSFIASTSQRNPSREHHSNKFSGLETNLAKLTLRKKPQPVSPDKTALLIDLDGTIITEDRSKPTAQQEISAKMVDFIAYALIGGNPVEIVTDGSFDHAQSYHQKIQIMVNETLEQNSYPRDGYKIAKNPTEYKMMESKLENKDKTTLYFGLNARTYSGFNKKQFLSSYTKKAQGLIPFYLNPVDNGRAYGQSKRDYGHTYKDTLQKINKIFDTPNMSRSLNNKTIQKINKVIVMGNTSYDAIDAKTSFPDMQPIKREPIKINDKMFALVSLIKIDREHLKSFFPKGLQHFSEYFSPNELSENLDFSEVKPLQDVIRDVKIENENKTS